MNKRDKAKEVIGVAMERYMDTEMVVKIWNDYCEREGMVEDKVYSMDDFEKLNSDKSLWDVVVRITRGNFNSLDYYYYVNEWGYFNSFTYIEDEFCIDRNKLVEATKRVGAFVLDKYIPTDIIEKMGKYVLKRYRQIYKEKRDIEVLNEITKIKTKANYDIKFTEELLEGYWDILD